MAPVLDQVDPAVYRVNSPVDRLGLAVALVLDQVNPVLYGVDPAVYQVAVDPAVDQVNPAAVHPAVDQLDLAVDQVVPTHKALGLALDQTNPAVTIRRYSVALCCGCAGDVIFTSFGPPDTRSEAFVCLSAQSAHSALTAERPTTTHSFIIVYRWPLPPTLLSGDFNKSTASLSKASLAPLSGS